MAYRDPEVRRARDRERFQRRTAERIARGLCPKCGERPPEPDRRLCAPCAEKRNRACRARDAKLRAAGKPRRDPAKARVSGRRHRRRQAAERRARGLCPNCGEKPPAPDASLCEPCSGQRREAARARYAKGKAAGKPYGGRDPGQRRKMAREKSRRRLRERLEAGLCTRCGHRPPAADGATCEPCREARQAAERELYAARRAAGLCACCGERTFDGAAACAPCAVRKGRRDPAKKNTAARRLYARRRAQGKCTDCGESAQGAARCEPCAKRSWERSEHVRGIPVWPPQYTVIELATGEDYGTYDSEAEVAMCLAFAKLSRDQVEVLSDISPMATMTGW